METKQHQISPERAIQQISAQYVRAADALDGKTLSNLFIDEGKVEIYDFNSGNPMLLFTLNGKEDYKPTLIKVDGDWKINYTSYLSRLDFRILKTNS